MLELTVFGILKFGFFVGVLGDPVVFLLSGISDAHSILVVVFFWLSWAAKSSFSVSRAVKKTTFRIL